MGARLTDGEFFDAVMNTKAKSFDYPTKSGWTEEDVATFDEYVKKYMADLDAQGL